MSRVIRKHAFCICENKDVDQLCGNRAADQRLCFHYIDSKIPLPKPRSETPKTGFLGTRLIYYRFELPGGTCRDFRLKDNPELQTLRENAADSGGSASKLGG